MSDKSIELLKQLKALAVSAEEKRTTGELFADDMEELLGQLISLDTNQFVAESKTKGNAAEGEAFLLCEEHEDSGGIRWFSVLDASTDKEALHQLLEAKANKDETGLLGMNGIEDWGPESVSSNYVDEVGYISYYIQSTDVLTREQALAKLSTEEYRDDFQINPGLRDVIKDSIEFFLEDEGFALTNIELAVDVVMKDSAFKGLLKNEWWYSPNDDFGPDSRYYTRARESVLDFLSDRVNREEPDWFVDIGAAKRFEYPKGMDQIMLDAVYDVSKALTLPLNNPQRQANEILKFNTFYDLFNSMGIKDDLQLADMRQEVYDLCYQYAEETLAPREKVSEPDLSVRVADANRRAAIGSKTTQQPEKETGR